MYGSCFPHFHGDVVQLKVPLQKWIYVRISSNDICINIYIYIYTDRSAWMYTTKCVSLGSRSIKNIRLFTSHLRTKPLNRWSSVVLAGLPDFRICRADRRRTFEAYTHPLGKQNNLTFHHLCHQQRQYLKGSKEHEIHKYLASWVVKMQMLLHIFVVSPPKTLRCMFFANKKVCI